MWNKTKEVMKWVGFITLNSFLWLLMLYLVGITKSKIPFIVSFIGVFPFIEEWFKQNHSNTNFKAHLFGVVEFTIVVLMLYLAPDVPNSQKVTFITAKLMALVMHCATGRIHFKFHTKQSFVVCFALHMLFNAYVCYARVEAFDFGLFIPYLILYAATYYNRG